MPNKFDFGPGRSHSRMLLVSSIVLLPLYLILGLIFVKSKKITSSSCGDVDCVFAGDCVSGLLRRLSLTNPPNKFGGEGAVKLLYLMILATHILMSLIVLAAGFESHEFRGHGAVRKTSQDGPFCVSDLAICFSHRGCCVCPRKPPFSI